MHRAEQPAAQEQLGTKNNYPGINNKLRISSTRTS